MNFLHTGSLQHVNHNTTGINIFKRLLQISTFPVIYWLGHHYVKYFFNIRTACTAVANTMGRTPWCDLYHRIPLNGSWMIFPFPHFRFFTPLTLETPFHNVRCMEEVAQPEVLYACWVLLLYLVMSGHFVFIRGAVDKINGSGFLAICSKSIVTRHVEE